MQSLPQNHTGRRPASTPGSKTLGDVVADFSPGWNSDWCWHNYKPIIKGLAQDLDLVRLCEIGGGRSPLLTPQEMVEMGVRLTINDISQSELDRAPAGYDKLCLDIAGDITGAAPAQFDLMFSQMVFEHVRDMKRAWRNVHELLAPGGVCLAFFPTLYALPFIVNLLVPDSVTGPVLRTLFPNRGDEGNQPKFPAYYDWCYGDGRKLKPVLEEVGFREVHVLPFWGHAYFRRLPVLRDVDAAFNRLAAQRNWSYFTTYAYVIVRK